MSDILVGFRNALMDSRYFSSGLTSLDVTRNPANSNSLWANGIGLGLKLYHFDQLAQDSQSFADSVL